MSEIKTNCAGVRRRDFLQLGLGAAAGIGFSDLLRLRAQGAAAMGKASPDEVRCILVWLDGGPSHFESFDPKPDAPREIRGQFGTIPTKIPGAHFRKSCRSSQRRRTSSRSSARSATRIRITAAAIIT